MEDGPHPRVIVNRFEQRLFAPGLKKHDIEKALGEDFAAVVPNYYRLVREAIDRGVPLEEVKKGNKITLQLRKLIAPAPPKAAPEKTSAEPKKLSLSLAR
jgi:pilus assembly protein CpaE